MDNELTLADLDFLLESLKYAKLNFEKTPYPTYEMRREKLEYVDKVRVKVGALREELEGLQDPLS